MAEIMEKIRTGAMRRRITRLCHFTPSRNLAHVAEDPRGVLASRHLAESETAVFNPTDSERLDGFPDHVCCSIQYPNAWYFRRARNQDRLFKDWVILLINPHYLWRAGTKFCRRNAAAELGRLVADGADAFEGLFAETVEGQRAFRRGPRRPAFLPTDEQAEVLIPDQVERQDVIGIAVRDEIQARRELERLALLGHRSPRIVIAPDFFEPERLSGQLRTGRIPVEHEHPLGVDDAR